MADITSQVERVREGLREHEAEYGVDPEALAALDSLAAAFEKIERERDEALHAEDVAERYREALEAALREIAEHNLAPTQAGRVARRALGEEP